MQQIVPAPLPSPVVVIEETIPEGPVETKWACHRTGAFGELCVYENLCFDGQTYLVFTNDTVQGVRKPILDQVRAVKHACMSLE